LTRPEVWEEFVRREAGKKGEKIGEVGEVPRIEAKALFWQMMRYVLLLYFAIERG
jgi:hypothetical protein